MNLSLTCTLQVCGSSPQLDHSQSDKLLEENFKSAVWLLISTLCKEYQNSKIMLRQ